MIGQELKMDEPAEPTVKTIKKKRKYTKRGPVKMIVDGKAYRGASVTKTGNDFVLTTTDGSVHVNRSMVAVVEIVGKLISPFVESGPVTFPQGVPNGPVIAGGPAALAARFNAGRNASLEANMSLPPHIEQGEENG